MDRIKALTIIAFYLVIIGCSNRRQFDSNGLRQPIADTLKVLENYDVIPGGVAGYRGEPSSHLETTYWFENSLTGDEAEILIHHENTFIRSIAFRKMWKVNYSEIGDIIIDSYKDSLIVYEQAGCERYEYRLFDYYIKTAGYPFRTMEANRRLTTRQKEVIDSLAMTKDYWIEYKKRMPPM